MQITISKDDAIEEICQCLFNGDTKKVASLLLVAFDFINAYQITGDGIVCDVDENKMADGNEFFGGNYE